MDTNEYRKRGKEMVDYIADYLDNIRERRVFPNVQPGYMRQLVPESAPLEGEEWSTIIKDIERVIMPGVTHWQSPQMHAYFPALNSFPSLLGDMLADGINCLGFTWASSPACTELETIVMNWLGKMIGLPDDFLHISSSSRGGGVIQTTSSEATLVCLLAGRTQAIRRCHENSPGLQDSEVNARLVAYCSDQAHSSVEKAALIGLVRMRYIEADEKLSLRGGPLREAIEDDMKLGLIPFWVCATLGTTGACAFDNLDEVGTVCQEYQLWLHVDAAYAGSAFICPEYRVWLKGIQKADSIAFNPSKWLMVHFDCTAMWVKNCSALHRTFNVEPLYLQHENSGLAIDYMHWQIPLSKRFRSLKLWFVLRNYGIKGLQKHIREGVRLAQKFEALVLADYRFEIPGTRHLGMVVFRLKGDNNLTERLLKRLNNRGNLHCVPASLKGKYVIRFTVTSSSTTNDDIIKDWAEIRQVTKDILEELNVTIDRAKVSLKDTREKNEAFGSSLLLANSPMSPKIVNGSFAAIFDADEFLAKAYAGIRIAHQDSPAMRRRVRGILMSGKQFSLDSRMDLVVQGIQAGSLNDSNESGGLNDKSRAIKEVNEDNWEACEREIYRIDCGLSPDCQMNGKESRQRSSSIDAAVQVHNRNLFDKTVYYRSEPVLKKNIKLVDDKFNDKIKCVSNCNNANNTINHKLLFKCQNNSLERISENQFLETDDDNIHNDFYNLTRRRNSDFGFYSMEKRKSEPLIRYAFYNRGFDLNKRFASQNDIELAKAPNMAEYNCDDVRDWKKMKPMFTSDGNDLPKPKIKVCISDESGHRIGNSLDSTTSDKERDNDNAIEQNLAFNENFLDRECNDHENVVNDTDTQTVEEQIYENINHCKKCGHLTIKF